MTAKDIAKAIRQKKNSARQYVIVEEVNITTGFASRRLDVVILDCFESHGFEIEGIEIKISRADLMRELKMPEKHEKFYQHLDLYTLAAPEWLIKQEKDKMPKEWGLLAVNEEGKATYIRKPKRLHESLSPIDRGFFASFVRASTNQARGEAWNSAKKYIDNDLLL